MKTIYTKLTNIQSELKAPKGQYNSFGKYNYRNLEDILEALKPLLAKNNTSLTISDEIVLIGDRFYVKATSTLIDNENGDSVSNTAYAREEFDKKGMDSSQITGSTSSYARKYSCNGLFLIDDSKDADYFDNSDRQPSQQQPVQQPRVVQQQVVNRSVPQQPQYVPQQQPVNPNAKQCPSCGNPMEYKEGVNKNGKPYKMNRCSCGEIEWIND